MFKSNTIFRSQNKSCYSYFLIKEHVMGTQKNRIDGTALLST